MSVSKLARQRGKILDEIMRDHRQRLPKRMRAVPLADVRALASIAPPPTDFRAALAQPGVSLIAECKKASPSRGLLVPDYDAAGLARAYAGAGASAVSVLTDARHFQGSLEDLRDVKEALPEMPVLRKDFIFHPYQIYEARAAGADAVLLIVSVLGEGELSDLHGLARQLGMDALVEVHSQTELDRALAISPRIVGINNRNLQTFEVDFENSARLRQRIPAGVAAVAESGITSEDDVRLLATSGFDAMLVGETLVRSKHVQERARELVKAGRPTP